MVYCRCGEVISSGRLRLGLKTCLKCGEAEAQVEIKAKQQRVAPDYNKGGYVYQGDVETARQRMREGAGKKNAAAPTSISLSSDPYIAPPTTSIPTPDLRAEKQRKVPKPKRRAVGVYYIGQEAYVWWDGDDPKTKGATRWARLRE